MRVEAKHWIREKKTLKNWIKIKFKRLMYLLKESINKWYLRPGDKNTWSSFLPICQINTVYSERKNYFFIEKEKRNERSIKRDY